MKSIYYLTLLWTLSFSALSTSTVLTTMEDKAISRGEYVFDLGGCASCHTKDQSLAGGVELVTPFGTFYGPNISPDFQYGIGGWTDNEFIKAMREGVSPEGEHYYPAFPYTSYINMSKQDLIDLKAYLDAQDPVSESSLSHAVSFPFNQRGLLGLWKSINTTEPWAPDPNQDANWNRGSYLANGPGHCTQCHTPRNLIGGLKSSTGMVGNEQGPEGENVPPLLDVNKLAFGNWSEEDIAFALEIGMTPEGDFLGGSMSHVLENTTGKMTAEDIQAISEYLYSLNNP
ncbi:cytochrome c [Candidatus Njordibacter sp. Uisw_039]|jgi:mono/diheme cytochrome c family protein|uniref:c-type cytochrome n=1 Tax=Candidatus Njordibacter sp. Uisw_039 TaxID=3230972 RepID=UPI003A3937E2|tara:strand:+ start:2367 stop:3224 length:858 start_codon:yes stop_codon:yes gene_type:complete